MSETGNEYAKRIKERDDAHDQAWTSRTALDKVNEVRARCGMRPIKAGARIECGWCHITVAATDEGTCPKCGCSAICPPWMS